MARVEDFTPEQLRSICEKMLKPFDALPPDVRHKIAYSKFGGAPQLLKELHTLKTFGATVNELLNYIARWEAERTKMLAVHDLAKQLKGESR